MGSITIFLKKHTLWVGFLAVLAPLLVMLGLQFAWLARLKQVSALAQKAAHNNYLEAIGTEAQFYYRSTAERALNIPASLFRQNRLGAVAVLWKKTPVEGGRRLFLVDFSRDRFGNYFLFDPERGDLDPYPASDEALAIIVACTPLQVLSYRGGVTQSTTLRVDERDPEYRIILNPITDDASRVVGIAGMILDDDFFRKELLPSIVKKALPAFFPGIGAGDLAVSVRDASGRVVLATGREGGDPHDGERVSATSRFPFVFADWTMSLHSPGTTPEQWASANFAFNVTLSMLLAVVLVGGIALALRAADRAVRLSGMKSDFVSNVSHELRTPLASIRVFAELLRLGGWTSRCRRCRSIRTPSRRRCTTCSTTRSSTPVSRRRSRCVWRATATRRLSRSAIAASASRGASRRRSSIASTASARRWCTRSRGAVWGCRSCSTSCRCMAGG